ncbi:phenylalanine--tRNA ligase subunit alpha [Methanobrevibacter acididurans]|uniref:phenylalanine--tRNA ligase subunit alpha n=1 Tax=Methanobrevibacter acididurans TaxID=120963 RepID=UPI0038FD0C0B
MSDDITKIINELHIYEKKLLKELEKDENITPDKIAENTGMDIKSVMSAAGSLASKDIIIMEKDVEEHFQLTSDGALFADEGLPERRVINVLKEKKQIPMKDLMGAAGLQKFEVNIAMGWLVRKNWAKIDKGVISITEKGENAFNNLGSDEELLSILKIKHIINPFELPNNLLKGLNELKNRKNLLKDTKKVDHSFKLTPLGSKILETGITIKEQATQLTHEQLESGEYEKLSYRPYDINAESPNIFPGKMHPLRKIIEEIRDIFLNMGFTESDGDILNSAFWNFDSLFQPQDHAAREMQDTFYVKNPARVDLPDEELVERVARTHEDGGETSSEGWGYKWDVEVAKQSVLRTHTTGISTKYLESHEPPFKMFSVGRVFRRETINYKHLPEFHQVEGVVAGENINFQNLLGILREFYKKLGFTQVRFRPAYFPYTYLSIETEVFFEEKDSWIELGGAGMFRPEVLKPLGIDTPALAFGLGIERLAMLRYDINDIRMLYKSDIKWLRELPLDKGIKLD